MISLENVVEPIGFTGHVCSGLGGYNGLDPFPSKAAAVLGS